MSEAIEKLLERIAVALEGQEKVNLGLSTESPRKWLYVGQEQGTCWYFRHNNENVPVIENSLTGYLKVARLETKEFKGKSELKLQLTIDAGIKYVIQSGVNTVFSRGVLLALNLLSEAELLKPITISVRPGNQESIVLGSVAVGGDKVRVDWDESLNLGFIVQQINGRLKYEEVLSVKTVAIPEVSDAAMLNLNDYRRKLFEVINRQVKTLDWGAEQGGNYLRIHYGGKISRSQLTDEELADFSRRLESEIKGINHA